MFLSYQQVSVSNAVLTVSSFTVPAKATHVELQADTAGVRYTMDNSTAPTTSSGMVLLITEAPRLFLIQDLSRIKIIRSGAADAKLNVHYFAGRDV